MIQQTPIVLVLLREGLHAFNSTSRYLDDMLDIDNPYSDTNGSQIYTIELKTKLNKANS